MPQTPSPPPFFFFRYMLDRSIDYSELTDKAKPQARERLLTSSISSLRQQWSYQGSQPDLSPARWIIQRQWQLFLPYTSLVRAHDRYHHHHEITNTTTQPAFVGISSGTMVALPWPEIGRCIYKQPQALSL